MQLNVLDCTTLRLFILFFLLFSNILLTSHFQNYTLTQLCFYRKYFNYNVSALETHYKFK